MIEGPECGRGGVCEDGVEVDGVEAGLVVDGEGVAV